MNVTYTLNVTVTRPVRSYFYDDVQTPDALAVEMMSKDGRRELEKEVLQALRKIDGDCDVEVMEAARGTDDEDDEPCLPDGTPIFPQRKLTRNEQLEGLADRGCDTQEDYRSER